MSVSLITESNTRHTVVEIKLQGCTVYSSLGYLLKMCGSKWVYPYGKVKRILVTLFIATAPRLGD